MPVNEKCLHQTDGSTFTITTVAWKFTFEVEEHGVSFYTRDHFSLEREIYWNPKTNKLITGFFMNKLAFFISQW